MNRSNTQIKKDNMSNLKSLSEVVALGDTGQLNNFSDFLISAYGFRELESFTINLESGLYSSNNINSVGYTATVDFKTILKNFYRMSGININVVYSKFQVLHSEHIKNNKLGGLALRKTGRGFKTITIETAMLKREYGGVY